MFTVRTMARKILMSMLLELIELLFRIYQATAHSEVLKGGSKFSVGKWKYGRMF